MGLMDNFISAMKLGDNEEGMIFRKTRAVERVASYFIDRLKEEGLSSSSSTYLEPNAYEVKAQIEDSELKNISIFTD